MKAGLKSSEGSSAWRVMQALSGVLARAASGHLGTWALPVAGLVCHSVAAVPREPDGRCIAFYDLALEMLWYHLPVVTDLPRFKAMETQIRLSSVPKSH